METSARLSKIIGILLSGSLLYSCAAIEAQNIADKEQMLAAAGFAMKIADTPDKLAHLQQQAQHKITAYTKGGETYFVYADATDCECLYVGDNSAYAKFQELQVQQNIASEQQMTAEMNQNAAMNWEMGGMGYGGMWGGGSWGMWGAGPWGYY